MEIRLLSLLEGARPAEGTAIIIDVYRAYTTAAVAFERGVEKIILVAEVEEALALRAKGLGDLCVGEVEGKRPAGFDFGNSPYEIAGADLRGTTFDDEAAGDARERRKAKKKGKKKKKRGNHHQRKKKRQQRERKRQSVRNRRASVERLQALMERRAAVLRDGAGGGLGRPLRRRGPERRRPRGRRRPA